MFRQFVSSALLTILVMFGATQAQEKFSLQINSGIISPLAASVGFSSSIQLNYSLSDNIFLYLSTGYSRWGNFNETFMIEHSEIQTVTNFRCCIEDNHTLISVYLGTRINIHKGKLFNSFVNVEAGYSYFKYNRYNGAQKIDETTGAVLYYYKDESTKKESNENVFGLGIGGGIFRSITDNINIMLAYKLNSHINSTYYGFFNNRGTYSTVTFGVTVGL